jgi:putative hydrolase of the HAD superfamily
VTQLDVVMGRRPLALLVDLDDTIVTDSTSAAPNWKAAVDAAAAVVPFPASTVLEAIDVERDWFWKDQERHRLGRADLVAARRAIVEAALRRVAIVAPVAETVTVAIVAAYCAQVEAVRSVLPGSIEALTAIRRMDIKLALVTNGSAETQRAKVERFGLAPLFDAIVIEGEFGLGKPEQAVYAHALSSLGVTAADAWMVGDNIEWDVAAPMRLGMRGIWISPGHQVGGGADTPVADAILPDLSALAKLLAGITDR